MKVYVLRSLVSSDLLRSIKKAGRNVRNQMFSFITPGGAEYYIDVPWIRMSEFEMRGVFNKIRDAVRSKEELSDQAIAELEGIIYESLGSPRVTQGSLYPLFIKK